MNNKYKILIVDNGAELQGVASALLEAGAYQVIQAESCSCAKLIYDSYMPDLIIQELSLPDADGMQLLQYVRSDSLTPIIILSVRDNEQDKVLALDAGANDYITKPFGKAELLARVRSALRNNRYSTAEGRFPGGKFLLNDLTIDYDARRIFVGSREVKLTQTEYNIIVFLSAHRGKMMPYSSIIKAVWGGYADSGSIKKAHLLKTDAPGIFL